MVDLDDSISGAIDGFENEIIQMWGGEDDGTIVLNGAQALSKIIVGFTETLILKPGEISPAEIRKLPELLEENDFCEEVIVALQIDAARKYCIRTRDMAERQLQLIRALAAASLSIQTQRFLTRVSRCYVFGFVPECIVMCRATLDTALSHVLPQSSGSTFKEKLKQARALRLFDQQTWSEVRDHVQFRGNKAVHDDPQTSSDAWESIATCAKALNQLYQGRSDSFHDSDNSFSLE